MFDTDHRDFIKKSRAEYKKIGSIACPAFNGEKVYFTKDGFKHLIYKNREYRPKNEQTRRIALIPHAVSILKSTKKFSECRIFYKQTKINGSVVSIAHYLWSISNKLNNQKITVVVRQKELGSKHFLSIMSDR